MERRHRLRAVRNLIAAVLLLAVFWWSYGCPLPTGKMRFHRSARQFLVEESDILAGKRGGGVLWNAEDTFEYHKSASVYTGIFQQGREAPGDRDQYGIKMLPERMAR